MNAENILLRGDCLDLLDTLDDGVADMVVCDPPYSSGGLYAGQRKASTKKKYTDDDYNGAARKPSFTGDNMDQRAFTEFMRWVCVKFREKTKEGGVIALFVDWRNLPAMTDAVQMAGWVWRGICVWDKGATRNIPGRFRNDAEYIVWGTNGDKKVDWSPGKKSLPGVYRYNSVAPKKRYHQTEKPVELMKDIIKIAPEGGTILDGFAGSGSTGVACVESGRRFIGIEYLGEYYEIMRQRIEKAEQGLRDADIYGQMSLKETGGWK